MWISQQSPQKKRRAPGGGPDARQSLAHEARLLSCWCDGWVKESVSALFRSSSAPRIVMFITFCGLATLKTFLHD
jgi:hypothetical protein